MSEDLSKRVTALETTMRKIQKSLASLSAELSQRGLSQIQKYVAADKPVRMTTAARKAQLQQQAALAREARSKKAAIAKKLAKRTR